MSKRGSKSAVFIAKTHDLDVITHEQWIQRQNEHLERFLNVFDKNLSYINSLFDQIEKISKSKHPQKKELILAKKKKILDVNNANLELCTKFQAVVDKPNYMAPEKHVIAYQLYRKKILGINYNFNISEKEDISEHKQKKDNPLSYFGEKLKEALLYKKK